MSVCNSSRGVVGFKVLQLLTRIHLCNTPPPPQREQYFEAAVAQAQRDFNADSTDAQVRGVVRRVAVLQRVQRRCAVRWWCAAALRCGSVHTAAAARARARAHTSQTTTTIPTATRSGAGAVGGCAVGVGALPPGRGGDAVHPGRDREAQ